MARMRWLIGVLSLGVFSDAQSRRAAILLTGHVRTFDLTAPTLDEFLIKANPTYTFSVFCATYQEREAPPQPRLLDGPPHDRETLG